MSILIVPARDCEVVFIQVPYNIKEWRLTSFFFAPEKTAIKLTMADKSSTLQLLPPGNYIFQMSFTHFFYESADGGDITRVTNDNPERIANRLTFAGYKVRNKYPKPNYKDRMYDDGTRRYINDFHDWIEEQRTLDEFLIYIKYPVDPDDNKIVKS